MINENCETRGVDRCLFQLPDGDVETVVPELDRLAALTG